MSEFQLRVGDRWEATYCQGVWGTPSAVGSRFAGRVIREINDPRVVYEDRSGKLQHVTVGLFGAWIRSQGARVVGRAEAPRPAAGKASRAKRAASVPPAAPKRRGRHATPSPGAHDPAFLTIPEAAADAGVTRTAIYYYLNKGELKSSGDSWRRQIARDEWNRFKANWTKRPR